MKKALCMLLVVLTLFSTFAVFVSAESSSAPSVMSELAGLRIDGKAFSESDFPLDEKDKNLYILAAAEKNFRTVSNSPQFELYFYIYNPSGMELKTNDRNSIQIGMDEDCESAKYCYFGIKIHSKSVDNRFLKISVTTSKYYSSMSLLLSRQKSTSRRVYNVALIRFVVDGKFETFPIKRAYVFKGYDYNNTLTASWKALDVLDVELHTTNWISPNAGLKVDEKTEASVYDHYEIHTVYFRVPKTYWDTYEYLYSIRATYDAVHLTPIIVTREDDRDFADDEGQATKNAILAGTSLSASGLEVYDLGWDNEYALSNPSYKRWLYTDSDSLYGDSRYNESGGLSNPTYTFFDITRYDALSYYFATLPGDFEYTEGADIVKAAISSQQLKEYFDERYDNPLFSSSALYSQYISNQDLSKSATEFKAEGIYKMSDYSDILSTKSAWEQWWTRHIKYESDSPLFDTFADEVQHISVLKDPGTYANVPSYGDQKVAEVAEQLFISAADMGEFSEVCKDAAAAGDYVVLLRVGFNDYSCMPVRDCWETSFDTGPYVAVAVDKWVYRNISVAELVFTKHGQYYTVPVASDVVDSFGNVDVSGDPTINGPGDVLDEIGDAWKGFLGDVSDFWDGAKKLLLWIGIGLAVLFVVFIVLKFVKPKDRIELVMPDGTGQRRKRRRRKRE